MNTINASEIKGDIPEGATHILALHDLFYRLRNEIWEVYMCTGDWCSSSENSSQLEKDILSDKLTEIIYDTDKPYVPKVGDHIEVTWGNKSKWYECVVLSDKWFSWKRYSEMSDNPWANREIMIDTEFRPIQSEEDKAVEKIARFLQFNTPINLEKDCRETAELMVEELGIKIPEGEK